MGGPMMWSLLLLLMASLFVTSRAQYYEEADDIEDATSCPFEGVRYADGEEWRPDPCTQCKCFLGNTVCDSEECPELRCPTHKYIPLGKCCPVCADDDAVFGPQETFTPHVPNPDVGQSAIGSPDYAVLPLAGPPGGEGEPGFPGRQGTRGPQGSPGSHGDPGQPGPPGPPGDSGWSSWFHQLALQQGFPPGDKGPPPDAFHFMQAQVGPVGSRGSTGPPGQPGTQGFQGIRGETGDTGPAGSSGSPGQRGLPGLPGKDGDAGEEGRAGANGPPGSATKIREHFW